MSIQLIQQYYSKVDQIIRYGGSRNESSLRKPFQDLLEQYARAKGLVLVAEVEMLSKKGTRIRPDGVLKDALRQDWGFWESKDEKDDIEAEIAVKFAKGYPAFNILFEDTHVAILYQNGERVLRVPFGDAQGLDKLLTLWASYEPREVVEFHKAIELFSQEIGGLAEVLREVISNQLSVNSEFAGALSEFLALCQKSINPKIEMADVREMVIQHVLTEDIFMRVFDEAEFHRENVIARKLQEVAGTFYHGETKRNIHARIAPYYEAINARASQISDHHEKQKFLKALYESFYRAYNPKAADRLGIVYTPDEIVRFMIESADHLTYQHFGKGLGERGVEILDPATGTGTFITELIEYLPPQQLDEKYEHEIHCNEVSILPYYIANLNIEYTFKQKMGRFKEFENICFVDTLDNMGFEHTGQQLNFFGLTDANAERITRQNSKPIMLVIGNPPYNAWQENFNNQNANRAYPEIDKRIKETYIKAGTAQNQIGVYDMYTRFFRWASDRLDKNGIVAFITNSSYLDSRAFDGFRKVLADEFSHIYIVDLGGNIRNNPKLSGTTHNVFGIQTGVCVAFLVKTGKKGRVPAQIFYTRRPELELATDKLEFLRSEKFPAIKFERIQPDKKHNWLNITDNDWDELLPLISKDVKSGVGQKAIFSNFSRGVETTRDEWVYDLEKDVLEQKIRFFIDAYNQDVEKLAGLGENEIGDKLNKEIKWSSSLTPFLLRGQKLGFNQAKVYNAMYRPFLESFLYFDDGLIHRRGQHPEFFPASGSKNLTICITDAGSAKPFMTLATDKLPDLHLVGAGASTQCLPLYRYTAANVGATRPARTSVPSGGDVQPDAATDGLEGSPLPPAGASLHPAGMTRTENITDWALSQFQKQYKDKKISKTDIFHYVYAVLHHPAYRAKYEINLKREFPRIPFYEDFHQWAGWGERLMELHLNYETVEPFGLERVDAIDPLRPSATSPKSDWGASDLGETARESLSPPPNSALGNLGEAGRGSKPRLMARKERGEIEIDNVTTLRGIPPEAWEYRLGTYSALEWVLERYKEKKPKDPTIAEKFNSYRFAEYKESVIELLKKVCRVSVETIKIVKEMPN